MKKLSVMLFPYHAGMSNGIWSPRQLVRDFACAGARGVEVMMGWPQKDAGTWAKFDEAARGEGLVYSCCDIGIGLISADVEEQKKARQRCMEQIVFSVEKLQCTTVMVYGSTPSPGMDFVEARKIYGENLGKLAEEAARYGVTVCIEDFDVPPFFSCACADMLEIMKYAGPVPRFTFDTGNFLMMDESPMDIYASFRPRMGHVHIKDFQALPEDAENARITMGGHKINHCLIGTGVAQIREVVHALQQDHFQGWISVEPCGGEALSKGILGLKYVDGVR